ncbi:Coiled-coil domain-containing protein [Verticillium dahliae VDG1]|nr:Coiled-coil domain-containing protein [Verticillium dahliae VDG1]
MQANDDLSALFSRNLTFNPELQPRVQAQAQAQSMVPKSMVDEPQQATQDRTIETSKSTPEPIVYSISQHYIHSYHVPQEPAEPQQQPVQVQEPQRRSSEPPQSDQLTPEVVLAQHGVNPAVLSPSQIQLFRISEMPQKERLVELWRVAPPTSNDDNPALAWTSTTVEQEELWARLRYERMIEAERQTANVEPYMMSGYEELMRRENERQAPKPKDVYSPYGSSVGSYSQATDPVYKSTGQDWSRLQQEQQLQMQMENQYGSYQQQQFGGPVGNVEAMDVM